MISLSRSLLLGVLLLGLALIVPAVPVVAQGGKAGESVRITTIDGVKLHGMFYRSGKPKAPTIIFLHAIGDSAVNKKLYSSLAQALQPDYSVMLFDFRGHGKSKDVDPTEFWKYEANQKGIRGAGPNKDTIEQGAFNKATYYPVLVNDIAAVKAYLDRRNDAGECNTSSTILIGAETGATLGAIWLNSQWQLKKLLGNPNNPFMPPAPAPHSEGRNVVACIWLSPTSKFGVGPPVRLSPILAVPVRGHGCATVFMHGEKDSSGRTLCDALVKMLKAKDDPKGKLIFSYAVPKTKLRGISLIQRSLGTEKVIKDYLDMVVEKRGNEWSKRDFNKTEYMWLTGGGMPATDRKLSGTNLLFDKYYKFMSAP